MDFITPHRMTLGMPAAPRPAEGAHAPLPPSLDTARRLIAVRKLRDRSFGDAARLFRDPAWNMLLDLFVAYEEGRHISASSAAIASGAPQSTGLRWVDDMVARGYAVRIDDRTDGRRSFVEISDDAHAMMVELLANVALHWQGG
ncbi:MAG: hypothetical protein B7Y45_00885 [Sphingomonas sp. 28-66-16]|nr:MAG: hypothetical protein B7Y45_00885 [Sphingomonas sp. 28-66-16]